MPFMVPSPPVPAPLFDAMMLVLAQAFAAHDVVLLVSPKLPPGAVPMGPPEVVGGATLPEDRMLGLLASYSNQMTAMLAQRAGVAAAESPDRSMPAEDGIITVPVPPAEDSTELIPPLAKKSRRARVQQGAHGP